LATSARCGWFSGWLIISCTVPTGAVSVKGGQHDALPGRHAVGGTLPERRRGLQTKGSIKLTEAPPLTQLARISLNAGR
jgi:hypothetical protein